jgi:hypothetical protein
VRKLSLLDGRYVLNPTNVTTIRVVERIAAKLSAERPVFGFRWGETAHKEI